MNGFFSFRPAVAVLIGLAALIVMGLGSCTGIVDPGVSPVSSDAPLAGQEGQLTFTIQKADDKTILGSTYGSSLANVWEVLLIDSVGTVRTLLLEADQTASIALPTESYRILALAGFRRSTSSTTAQCLGSAYVPDLVSLGAGESKAIDLVLRSLDFTFEIPAAAETGANFTCSLGGSSRNPYVGMSLEGSTSMRPRMRSTALWAGYGEFGSISGTSTEWLASLTAKAPYKEGSLDLGFCGAPLVLTGCGTADGSLSGRTVCTWKWPNTYDLQDEDTLKTLVQKSIAVTAPSTGLSFGLGWE